MLVLSGQAGLYLELLGILAAFTTADLRFERNFGILSLSERGESVIDDRGDHIWLCESGVLRAGFTLITAQSDGPSDGRSCFSIWCQWVLVLRAKQSFCQMLARSL
ncbi:hypothetical protein H4582DRAFT_1904211 [Lactarius indigo]|nr:hypothetical protein H4582DRAFT_1904211 [Lactarius indigo]